MSISLTDEKKAFIFKALAEKSQYNVGIDFGFDKYYSNPSSIRQAIYKIYNEVKANPEKFYITPQTAEMVESLMKSRLGKKPANVPSIKESQELEKVEMRDLILQGRRKSYLLLNDKLDRISSSKKKLDEVGVTALAQVFGIMFDKAQIIQGESTENIAIHAKVNKDMSAEDAMDLILKMREGNTADKSREKKK